MNENNNLPSFVDDFVGYLIAIKNMSPSYAEIAENTISQFLDYVNVYKLNNKYEKMNQMDINDLRGLTNSDVYGFMFYLAEVKYKPNSRITKVEHLKSFFKYLFKVKHNLFTQPFKEVKIEKRIKKSVPNYLSLEESKKLIAVYADDTTFLGVRNYAMITMFLNCGLRVNEISNLKISDINFSTNTFSIIGKGNKERTGYINDSTREVLLKYLEMRKNIEIPNKKDNDVLFVNRFHSKFSTRNIRAMIKKTYTLAGIDNSKYSVHTLRHTCATLLYKSGIDIKIIQELLGHSQVTTTEIYAHTFNSKAREAMLNNPLAHFKMQDALNYCIA